MSSLGALLNVAGDALTAQSGALDVTGQNITNATTPGYVRRTPGLENLPLGQGQSGGVLFTGAQRVNDRFADARVVTEGGLEGAATARLSAIGGLEAVVAPASGGIGDGMNAFFSAATDLASNANDPTARATFLARAGDVAQQFNSASAGLQARQTDLYGQAQATSSEINDRLSKIADYNQKIASAQALGEPAADLRDSRDKLIGEVGDRIGVQTIQEANGSVTLLSSGTSLVQGGTASSVSATLNATGGLEIDVSKGGGKVDVTSRVTSGSLSGVVEARDKDIPALQKNLDQLAYDFSNSVNAVQTAGVGLDGVGGRPLYTPLASATGAAGALTIDPSVAGQPDHIAAAANPGELPGGNTQALAMAAISSQQIGAGGLPADRFGQLAAQLGGMQSAAQSDVTLRKDTLATATSMQQQVSGVSVEEEMTNLSRYQNAFQAAQRVLKVADDLLQGLIQGL